MTSPRPVSESRNYQVVIDGLLRMHRFALDGLYESNAADALRESMSEPWEGLTDAERKRVTGLSQDLYEISDDDSGRVTEPMTNEAQWKLNKAYEGREQGEWDRALEVLRRWGKYVPPALLAYLRGTIWRAMGNTEVAAVFFKHTAELEPERENLPAELVREAHS
jgi:hypothetical protein